MAYSGSMEKRLIVRLLLRLRQGLLGIVVVAVAGLASFILLGIVGYIIYGAIKGAVSEVKNFLKEMKG